MGRRLWVGRLAVFLFTFVLGSTGCGNLLGTDVDRCYACRRPIHAHSKTVAIVNGRPRVFCCPACALSMHEQSEKPVTITRLTSFPTGTALSPDEAYIVSGSNVNLCERTRELIDADKRPADLRYDRCAPSLIAFARRDDAVQFAREHGGEVRPFSEIAAAFAK